MKILLFVYLQINKQNRVFKAIYLENCFDRMAHPVPSLASQWLEVAPKVAQCMINTLCKMKHYIWTAYEDSDWYYGGDKETLPLQGSVQANGAASPIFIAISCIIISYLKHQTPGV